MREPGIEIAALARQIRAAQRRAHRWAMVRDIARGFGLTLFWIAVAVAVIARLF